MPQCAPYTVPGAGDRLPIPWREEGPYGDFGRDRGRFDRVQGEVTVLNLN